MDDRGLTRDMITGHIAARTRTELMHEFLTSATPFECAAFDAPYDELRAISVGGSGGSRVYAVLPFIVGLRDGTSVNCELYFDDQQRRETHAISFDDANPVYLADFTDELAASAPRVFFDEDDWMGGNLIWANGKTLVINADDSARGWIAAKIFAPYVPTADRDLGQVNLRFAQSLYPEIAFDQLRATKLWARP